MQITNAFFLSAFAGVLSSLAANAAPAAHAGARIPTPPLAGLAKRSADRASTVSVVWDYQTWTSPAGYEEDVVLVNVYDTNGDVACQEQFAITSIAGGIGAPYTTNGCAVTIEIDGCEGDESREAHVRYKGVDLGCQELPLQECPVKGYLSEEIQYTFVASYECDSSEVVYKKRDAQGIAEKRALSSYTAYTPTYESFTVDFDFSLTTDEAHVFIFGNDCSTPIYSATVCDIDSLFGTQITVDGCDGLVIVIEEAECGYTGSATYNCEELLAVELVEECDGSYYYAASYSSDSSM